ncbi:MAG TPA: ABC transporter permease subunit [Pirellulales bacterium]|jgi:ABC-type dipeptide/oligopeptide/nickel transport system permease component|nr:ABC transporter permease subunit [Pirellulales bacterium]
MIPTLFGITIVSFCIMQLAPGDPVANQLSSGNAPQGGETSEMYELRKRELHLDKPLVLNFRYFRNYRDSVRAAAFYEARSNEQVRADLKDLAAAEKDPAANPPAAERLRFLRSLKIPDFKSRLAHPDQWERLPPLIEHFVSTFCSDIGSVGVGPAIAILDDPQSDMTLRIGAVRCLARMVSRPFAFTYPIHPVEEESQPIMDAWRIWWNRHRASLPKPDAEATKYFDEAMKQMVISRDNLFAQIDQIADSDYLPVAPAYFAERLLGQGTLADKVAASTILKQLVPEPLKYDLPIDASAKDVDEATAVWLEHYKLHQAEYEPSLGKKLWAIVADTQYAYMVVRLVTFHFGESALKTREPVGGKIWEAFIVSAPLMFMSGFLIYLIAVPLGILCGVYRGRALDKGISLGLFILYSIPAFVAGMMFLVFFCYGDYLKWFPALDLHSENADAMSFVPYMLDYFWHAFLPVVCLSLFSLAAMAMYARSSVLDVINQDYVRTARAKGVSGPKVIVKHVMRNAMIPILTLFSNFLPELLGGSVLVEFLFNIPGMGRLGLTSIEQKDIPTLMALLYIEAIVTLISFLITDFLYVVVDPRISFGGKGDAA